MSTGPGYCDCCTLWRDTLPYHHDAHDDSGDSWDYCRACWDEGCDLRSCSLPPEYGKGLAGEKCLKFASPESHMAAWTCSLRKGHAGDHVAYRLHNLDADILGSWEDTVTDDEVAAAIASITRASI